MFNPFRKIKKGKSGTPERKIARQPVKTGTESTEIHHEVAHKNVPAGKYPLGVLIAPRFTEKAVRISEAHRQYVFEITQGVNALQVRSAVEQKYRVHVIKVNIARHPGKAVRLGRREGWRPGIKKAIVTIAKGEKIELT